MSSASSVTSPHDTSLKGRTILVTGAGAGLGRGICLACAELGASIIVASPRENGVETVREVTDRGGQATWIRADATIDSDLEAAVAAAVDTYGSLDAVVHNATSRYSAAATPIEQVSLDEWDDHVAVTLRAAYVLARASLPHLAGRDGRFVLMTSPAGMEGATDRPAYSAVKGAIRGFTKSLALEWGKHGVAVTCVSPLAVTPALANAYKASPQLEEKLRTLVPLGRVGDSETDIGPVIAFLTGPGSRYITGQTLVVDGGRFLGL